MNEPTRSYTLAEALPMEQSRVRELLVQYKAIGPAGAFGAAMLEQALSDADKAAAEQDTVAMLRAYQQLEQCE